MQLVSIVMPSLNQVRYIEAAIDSVLSQDYPNLELVVADGGSSDGTQALLAAWQARDPRLRWFSERDGGPAQAVNKALAKACGTLVGWLNSDDLYAPGAVSRAVLALEAEPDKLMVYGQAEHIDAEGKPLGRYPTRTPEAPLERFAEGCFICQPTVFFRRSMFVLLGKFDEQLKTAFDFEYWLRAFRAFPDRIGFVDAVQAYSRLHADCITLRSRRTVALEGMQLLARYLGHAPKEWLLTYFEELLAQPPAQHGFIDLRLHAEEAFAAAEPYMSASDRSVLRQQLQADTRLDQRFEMAIASKPAAYTEPVSKSENAISPTKIIDQFTLTEHLGFADAYFTGRESHLYLYQKPFYHPRDCAPAVSNLGLLLAGARLEPGMHVLDFAAGSCWLSRILVQLGCVVTSCDASAKALDIGKALFEKYPPILPGFTPPAFSVFDGVHLEFPDGTFDRVIINDSFHHVSNPQAVLAELYRVLKADGVVAMSEPGRFHSRTADSQYEMSTFNVIENDVVLEDLWAQAQQAGFREIRISPVLRQPYLNIDEYLACIRGQVPPSVSRSVVQETINHSIFFLHKTEGDACGESSSVPVIMQREEFDEAFYLQSYPDVQEAISIGRFVDAWEHYERHGRTERRRGKP